LPIVARSLVERVPEVAPERLVGELVPPPIFSAVSFDSYQPDPGQPTQAAAVEALRTFADRVSAPPAKRSFFRKVPPPESRPGVYLDGGFGVGKTHLLASLWHAVDGPKAFGTFVELTNLVGALGFEVTVAQLGQLRFLAIDEFELDDPGDTVLMSTLLSSLVEQEVFIAATSNTLPESLGEGRFAAADFLREIQGLAAHFDVVRVDGQDYRHRGHPVAPQPFTAEEVVKQIEASSAGTVDDFERLLYHLGKIHPSKYGALLDGVTDVGLLDVYSLPDQSVALRMVVLADRLYDRGVRLIASGVPLDQLFTKEMMAGGYRKKYRRALSRLIALARADSEDANA
jgi:cell division protein ZapE